MIWINFIHESWINRVCVGVRRWFRWWLVWSARCSRATARAPSTAEASVCRSPFLTSKTTSSRISNSSTASYRRIRVRTTGLCRPEPGFTWRRPCRRSDAPATNQMSFYWTVLKDVCRRWCERRAAAAGWRLFVCVNVAGSKSQSLACVTVNNQPHRYRTPHVWQYLISDPWVSLYLHTFIKLELICVVYYIIMSALNLLFHY